MEGTLHVPQNGRERFETLFEGYARELVGSVRRHFYHRYEDAKDSSLPIRSRAASWVQSLGRDTAVQ